MFSRSAITFVASALVLAAVCLAPLLVPVLTSSSRLSRADELVLIGGGYAETCGTPSTCGACAPRATCAVVTFLGFTWCSNTAATGTPGCATPGLATWQCQGSSNPYYYCDPQNANVCGASQEPNDCSAATAPVCAPPGCVAATNKLDECFNCD